MHWSYTKVEILLHAITEIWTDTQMRNSTQSMAPHHSTILPN